MAPFAVVGSEQVHSYKGRLVLGRQNGWGLVQIEESTHCEFNILRNLLIRFLHYCFFFFSSYHKSLGVLNKFFLFVIDSEQEPDARFNRIDFSHPLRSVSPTTTPWDRYHDWHRFTQREPHLKRAHFFLFTFTFPFKKWNSSLRENKKKLTFFI